LLSVISLKFENVVNGKGKAKLIKQVDLVLLVLDFMGD